MAVNDISGYWYRAGITQFRSSMEFTTWPNCTETVAHVELFFPRRFEDEGGSKKNNEKRPRFQKIFVSATGPFSLHEARAAPKSVHDRTGERPRDAER
jgi:hypothetical protein